MSLAVLSRLFDWCDALVVVRPETLIRWHRAGSRAIVACDFFVAVTATFRLLYVFVVIEHGSRRVVRVAVTAHPTAAGALQQLREVVGFDRAHQYLVHDRDSIFARSLDESIRNLGLTVLKSPPHSPKANAICERVIGTIRRECLDWLIPLSESHLRSILRPWVGHYNHGRPHMALGPGVPAAEACPLDPWNSSEGSSGASTCRASGRTRWPASARHGLVVDDSKRLAGLQPTFPLQFIANVKRAENGIDGRGNGLR